MSEINCPTGWAARVGYELFSFSPLKVSPPMIAAMTICFGRDVGIRITLFVGVSVVEVELELCWTCIVTAQGCRLIWGSGVRHRRKRSTRPATGSFSGSLLSRGHPYLQRVSDFIFICLHPPLSQLFGCLCAYMLCYTTLGTFPSPLLVSDPFRCSNI
jgi:hypothetical protein